MEPLELKESFCSSVFMEFTQFNYAASKIVIRFAPYSQCAFAKSPGIHQNEIIEHLPKRNSRFATALQQRELLKTKFRTSAIAKPINSHQQQCLLARALCLDGICFAGIHNECKILLIFCCHLIVCCCCLMRMLVE